MWYAISGGKWLHDQLRTSVIDLLSGSQHLEPSRRVKPESFAGLDLRQHFNKQMQTEFKKFQFCDANWKMEVCATEYYPNWCGKYSSKMKSEDSTACLDMTSAKSRK